MPRPKKRRGFNRRGGLPERPHRLPQRIEAKDPTLIRHDYGYRDGRPDGMSAIAEFDADRRRNPRPNPIIREANRRAFRPELQYDQGGEVKSSGPSIKIPGQYAVDSIKTTPEGNQYVSMELADGKVVPVFGDWETYGNPNQEGLIEDLDYRIYPLGDGTYALDAGEMESEMLRDESRRFAEDTQGGPGASRMEDLLEKLNQRKGMGFTPDGRMRPAKRQ